MTGTDELEDAPPEAIGELRQRLNALVETLLAPSGEATPFGEVIASARQLVHRKLELAGTKQETRDHIEGLIGAHLRGAFDGLTEGISSSAGHAESLLGTLVTGSLLADFTTAIEKVILDRSEPREFSLAGLADFISLEEVLQLLGGAKHRGLLTLERPDNCLDIYLDDSTIAFLDPHRFIRRVLPTSDGFSFREIGVDVLREAEEAQARDGIPIFIGLQERGFFKEHELREMMRWLGVEVLYEFLGEQQDCAYAYQRLHELPPFAVRYNMRMPVTPILLEGNKRLDDWRSMKRVFPDPDDPLEPVEDMISKISSLQLSVLEIKMLAQIGSRLSPRRLSPNMGLPMHDIYQFLIRFAKEGVIVPPGGLDTLEEVATTIEESVEMAMQALDANDDDIAVSSALDKVLGFGEEEEPPSTGTPRLRSVMDPNDPED